MNLGGEKGKQKITVYEHDDPATVAKKFADEHQLTEKKA